MRFVLAAFVLASAHVMLGGAAWAQGPAQSYDPRAAFAQVDTNKDGQIDIEEFHVRLVEVFYSADTNKDGFLSADEYARLPFSGAFKAADTNGDGRISLAEFVTIRFRQFEAADTNHDYQLSVDEVVTAYEGGQKQ
ncbi:MAG TPA: EF-hand domain-containing protein [Candidatus Margulisiibacteriota bacterium]|nr:EF-hand domain-containing protein [Candidatus Margulisiibacteriota bacterium]